MVYPFPKRRPPFKKSYTGLPRRNNGIRAREVRVIGLEGKPLGVFRTEEALAKAREAGLDLVEVAPGAIPPVCKILDFGKYLYEESKKQKKASKPASSKLKEIKFGATIEKNDYGTKLRHAEGFLSKGNKLKLHLTFRGREMENQGHGREIMANMVKDLDHIALADGPPQLSGRNLLVLMTPLPVNKRVLKYHYKPGEDTP
jgi:translation initiation factor IF-3